MAELQLMATRNPVNSPVAVGSLSHDFQGFIHARDQGINLQQTNKSLFEQSIYIYTDYIHINDSSLVHNTTSYTNLKK